MLSSTMNTHPLRDVPRLPDAGRTGSLGPSTSALLNLQRELAARSEPLARGRLFHVPLLFTCTAEAAHEVLVTKARSFEKSPGFRVLLHTLAGQGLFTSEGALWRRQRRLMAPLFQPAPIHEYAETMRRVAERAADGMRDGQSLDLARVTTQIAMSVVGKALFDADTFDEADALGAALTTCLGWLNDNLGAPQLVAHVILLDVTEALAARTRGRVKTWASRAHAKFTEPLLLPGVRAPELRAAVRLLDERVQAMIDQRRREGLGQRDLLTRLLTARDEDAGGERMSDKQVRDEAVTLFVAGHETTASSLAWAFYLLARHPEALARAQAEADAFGDGEITSWDPSRLAFCTRVFKEAMRLYPPIMIFSRRSLEDVEICGQRVPARTPTFVSAWALHHREDLFPKPRRFDPDRWLPEHDAARPKGAYLPFGAGPRLCIGTHFALMEGPLVLATLLRRFRFDIDPHRVIEEDDFATLRPRGGVPAVVRAR
jgi:cytochrome P450